jgi:hypothetical protein
MGVVAELMTKDAEGARGIAEALGHIRGGLLLDEEGAESLVLALEGEFGGEEKTLVGMCCYLITSTGGHNIIMLQEHPVINMFYGVNGPDDHKGLYT